MPSLKHLSLALAALGAQCMAAQAAEPLQMTTIGRWQNVTSFSIDARETHIVFSVSEAQGRERIYETTKQNGGWSLETSIGSVNNYDQQAQVGGVCLTPDAQRLYYHANYRNGKGGYDIYYVDRTPDGWSDPVMVDALCSEGDDKYPALTPGESQIWFVRRMPTTDVLNFRQDPLRQQIYSSQRNDKGQWTRPLPTSPVLDMGYTEDARPTASGRDALVAQRADKKEQCVVLHSEAACTGVWGEPEVMLADAQGFDYYNPLMVGGQIYCLRATNKKRVREGQIVCCKAEGIGANRTADEELTIIDAKSRKPLQARAEMVDMLTGAVVSRYSVSDEGRCLATIPTDRNVALRITHPGYTQAYLPLRANAGSHQRRLPQQVELWGSVELSVVVNDAQSFELVSRPKVVAVRQDKTIFRSENADGRYVIELPVGADYHVIVTAPNYAQADFGVALGGEVVTNSLRRNVSLDPLTHKLTLRMIDNDSRQPQEAEVSFASGAETLTRSGSAVETLLRQGQKYDICLTAPGYADEHMQLTIDERDAERVVSLAPLKKGLVRALGGITFAPGTDLIEASSASAIESVARLLRRNANLEIEIAAGGEGDNALALRRAKAVAELVGALAGCPQRIRPQLTAADAKEVRYVVTQNAE